MIDELPCLPSSPGVQCSTVASDYLVPFIFAGIGLVIAFASRHRDCIDFALCCVGQYVVVGALVKIQEGDGRWIWPILAIVASIDTMSRFNRFFDLPNNRRERREAKLWNQLMGRETLWNLLVNDPRRKTWRKPA